MTCVEKITDTAPEEWTANFEKFRPRLIDWSAVRTFASKNLRISMRYPANFIIWGFLPILWQAPVILMAIAIGGSTTPEHFTRVSGFDDFIKFTVIAWFVMVYLQNSIWGIGNTFRWEQFSGTLEPLFCAPVPRISILLGGGISDTITGTIEGLIQLIMACAIFGVSYSLTMIAPVIIIMLLMIMALFGLGFMFAGLIIVFKDPSVLTQLVSTTMTVLTPVTYPVESLPAGVRVVSYMIPTTIALITIRHLMITSLFDAGNFIMTIGLLGLLAICLWAVGLAAFWYAERWTKQRGHMGGF